LKQEILLRDTLSRKTTESQPWELDSKELEFVKCLGSGGSGEVYKGYYRTQPVALKILKTNVESEITEFIKEFTIFINVKSPNIVSFIGATLSPKLCMVMEFCDKGSLFNLLSDSKFPLDWSTALSFTKEIVLGVQALHTHNPAIIHRDLKTLNVLVTRDYHCKIADFGLSRTDTNTNLGTLLQCKGTYLYIAPECYFNEKTSIFSDIYSLSIIMWEIFNTLKKEI